MFLQPNTPATQNFNSRVKTLYVGNLSFSVQKSDMYLFFSLMWFLGYFICLTLKLFRENFFRVCGEVVDVRLASCEDGKLKGFGHVEFATAEAAQYVRSWHLFNLWILRKLLLIVSKAFKDQNDYYFFYY